MPLPILAVLVAAVTPAASSQPVPCVKTFDRHMITRAIDAEYSGVRHVSAQNRRDVRRFIRCARPGVNQAAMRRRLARKYSAWQTRRADRAMAPALASYYTTEGTGACGFGSVQTGYRFASLFLPCGQMVRFCHGSSCIEGQMADHGPYVGGRLFDLNANMRAALACPGLCWLRWRRL